MNENRQAPTPAKCRLVPGLRAQQLRVQHDRRGGVPVVRLDVMEPLTTHAPTLCVVGRPVLIPIATVQALIEAMDAVRREHMEATSDA